MPIDPSDGEEMKGQGVQWECHCCILPNSPLGHLIGSRLSTGQVLASTANGGQMLKPVVGVPTGCE